MSEAWAWLLWAGVGAGVLGIVLFTAGCCGIANHQARENRDDEYEEVGGRD